MNLKKLLTKAKPATAELEDALTELQAREKEIAARITAIQPGTVLVSAGPERKRVELEGEPADIVALDRELAELRAERAALPTKAQVFQERLQQVRADDAARALPGQLKALPDTLKRLQAAQAAADKAKAELQDALTAVGIARRAVEDTGGKAPGLDYETAAAIADALGHEQPEAPTHFSSARAHLFDRLGAEQREIAEAEKAAQALTKRDGFATSKADDTDLARHPEQSIWAKKAI